MDTVRLETGVPSDTFNGHVQKSAAVVGISNFAKKQTFCSKNVRSCLVWGKIGICDLCVDVNVSSYVNFC